MNTTAHDMYLPESRASRVCHPRGVHRPRLIQPRLTPQEQRVAELVSEGLGTLPIANRLGISVGTLRVYLSRIYQKVGLKNRTQLALWWTGADIGNAGSGDPVLDQFVRNLSPVNEVD